MDYVDILDSLNIRNGEILHISSDIIGLALKMSRRGGRFEADKLIDGIIKRLGDGTLIFPLYNWDFCKGEVFDYKHTPGKTGFLGNAALAREDFKRTKHPIYSFAVYGKDQDYLCKLDNISSFGLDSPFHYMYENHARQIAIDLDHNNFFTFCYYIEEQTNFPYRFMKYFESDYINDVGVKSRRKYGMYVRHLDIDIRYDATELFRTLLENNIMKETFVDGISIKEIDVHASYKYFEDDLLNNQGRNQYKYFWQGAEPYNSLYSICEDLFPLNRSLSGQGVRDTLNYISRWLPELNVYEEKSGTEIFDWTVPPEWNVNDAYVEDMDGNRIIDFKQNNLHLMGYSEPVNEVMTFAELDKHLHSLEAQPQAVPYITSYYKRNWGFCLSHEQRIKLRANPDAKYRVRIDSSLDEKGVVNYADAYIAGAGDREVMFSVNICHPSLANNELSGMAVAIGAARYIKSIKNRRYNYRFVFVPETIGSLIYLNKHMEHLQDKLDAGFVLTCIGDNGDYSCIHSPYSDNLADKVASHMLKCITDKPKEYSYLDRGSDERQYCAPQVALPFCTLTRTKFAEYPEYHTSLDNMDFISEEGLAGGLEMVKRCIDLLEVNEKYVVSVIGEPQLGKRGLYPLTSTKSSGLCVRSLMNFIAYADGKNDLIDIAEIINENALTVRHNAEKLLEKKLLMVK